MTTPALPSYLSTLQGAVAGQTGYPAMVEGQMGVVQVQLPDDLKDIIDRQIAEGRAPSADAYVEDALRLYADHLDAEDEIVAMAERADADITAGRYVTVSTPEDSEALHQRTMDRLRENLASDTAAR